MRCLVVPVANFRHGVCVRMTLLYSKHEAGCLCSWMTMFVVSCGLGSYLVWQTSSAVVHVHWLVLYLFVLSNVWLQCGVGFLDYKRDQICSAHHYPALTSQKQVSSSKSDSSSVQPAFFSPPECLPFSMLPCFSPLLVWLSCQVLLLLPLQGAPMNTSWYTWCWVMLKKLTALLMVI